MNAAGKAVLAVGIIGTVAVAVPYLIGMRIESEFRAGVAELAEQTPYPISISRYQRGLYSAEADTAIEIALPPEPHDHDDGDHPDEAPAAPRMVTLHLHHEISHGPRLDGLLRSGRLVTTPRLEGDLQAAFAPLFGDAPVFTLITDLGYLGGISGSLRSPPIDSSTGAESEAKTVHWAGIDSNYSFGGGHFLMHLEAPELSSTSATAGQAAGGPLVITADMRKIDDGPLWIGSSSLSIASITTKTADGAFALNQLALASDTKVNDGQLDSGVQFSAASLEAAGARFDKLRLDFALDHLDAAATTELSLAIRQYQQAHATDATAADPMVMMAALKPAFGRLAGGHPEARIKELSFTGPSGSVAASGSLRYVGDANLDDFSLPADVEAEGQFEAPLDYVNLVLGRQVRTDLAANAGVAPEEVPPEVLASALQNARDGLLAQGLLVVDGQQATSTVSFRNGALTINGKTLGVGGPSH